MGFAQDDTEEVIQRRLEVFARETQPVLDFYLSLDPARKEAAAAPLVKHVQISGGFKVMAPVFEAAVGLPS